MSMMVSFVLSFFPRDVLDEILNLIESVSEDFPSYSLRPPVIITDRAKAVLSLRFHLFYVWCYSVLNVLIFCVSYYLI